MKRGGEEAGNGERRERCESGVERDSFDSN